jgi:hypothetical protein
MCILFYFILFLYPHSPMFSHRYCLPYTMTVYWYCKEAQTTRKKKKKKREGINERREHLRYFMLWYILFTMSKNTCVRRKGEVYFLLIAVVYNYIESLVMLRAYETSQKYTSCLLLEMYKCGFECINDTFVWRVWNESKKERYTWGKGARFSSH